LERPVLPRILLLLFLELLIPSGRAVATDLKVTDSRGVAVVVTNVSIEYGGFLGSEKETEGIRVLQGDGVVLLKWSDFEGVRVTRRDDSTRPPRVELEIVLRTGKKAEAALFRQGEMKLLGKTDLGDYSIELDKIRVLTRVR
jgi:hypothetical protein